MARRLVLSVVLGLFLTAALPAQAADVPPPVELAEALLACKKLPPDKRLRLTLHGEVGAQELVAALAPLSCRPIVIGGAALRGGKVTIEAPDLLTPAEATRLLISAIDSLGLSIEVAGGSYRVVDSARGKEIATELAPGERRAREAFVVRLIRLADASAEEVAATVGKIKSKEGEVSVLPLGRAILLIDRAAQVERMEALAHALDRPSLAARMFVLPTHRTRPSELVEALDKIALGGAPRGDKTDALRPVLLPVDGARVILFSGSDTAFQRVEALLARIDPPLLPGEERGGRIAVYYLKHVVAEDLAATVKEVLTNARSNARPTGAGAPMQGGPSSSALEGEVRVTADKVGNALVVSGTAADLESVRELVARLDLPRRQVYVEAVVLDLSADMSRAVGLSLHQTGGTDSGSVSGFAASSSSSGVNALTLDPAKIAAALSGGGLLAGVLGKSFDIAGMSVPSFGVVLQALETSRDVSVLSRPHLLTLDHVKASLSVGQKIPFPTGQISTQATGSANSVALQTSYTRQDVALRIDLTPHLSDEQEIRLEIDGEISDVAGSGGAGGPITNQRTIKTTVVVHDGQTVVLGGLQKESASDQVDKVPILGDIPVLGRLFQTRSKQRIKQDLLIVITPYIIRDSSDLRRIYERREAERHELLQRATLFSDAASYDPHVDYSRKRGLLEEINLVAQSAEDEGNALRLARTALAPRAMIQGGEVLGTPRSLRAVDGPPLAMPPP